jgi:chemotaxis protein histidine kinase CheA
VSKENVDDLLGGDAAKEAPAAAKKAATKAPSKPAKEPKTKAEDKAPTKASKPAKDAPAAAKKEAAPAAEKPARQRSAMVFEEGERDKLYKGIEKALAKVDKKKGINSRELAEKLGTETRKLRVCLYTLQNQGTVKLKSGDSKVAGMQVHPA